MEAAEEGDGIRSSGVMAGEFEGSLDGLRAGVRQERLGVSGHRGETGEALADVGVGGQVEVARAVVQDVVDLGVDRRVDGGMGVAGGDDGDPGVEVQEAVAIDIFDDTPATAPDDQRVHAGQRRTRHCFVARDDRGGLRAGQFGPQIGSSRISREVISNAGHRHVRGSVLRHAAVTSAYLFRNRPRL